MCYYLGFEQYITCTRPRHGFTVHCVCVSLADASPARPWSDEHLVGQARRLGERVVAWTGQRQERGLLNQPAIQRPSINPPNGLGWGM